LIEIRTAAGADIEAVAALFLRCWRGSYAGVLPARVMAVFDEASARDLWHQALGIPAAGMLGFVAVAAERVVGIIRLGSDAEEPAAGHVLSLYIDPSMQGQGVGGRLLREADAWFRIAGMPEATLWVFAANAPALRFYASHGWHPDGGTRVEARFGEPEIRLRRAYG